MANGLTQYKRFVFTQKCDITHDECIRRILNLGFTKYCFQQERGLGGHRGTDVPGLPEDGKTQGPDDSNESKGFLHYQGRVSGTKPFRIGELVNASSYCGYNFHWEIERDARGSQMYVTKELTRISGPWSDRDVVQYVPRRYRALVLRPSQTWILGRLANQSDRKMLFIVDPRGGTGKSTLGMYLSVQQQAIRIPASVRTAEDIMAIVMAAVASHPERTRTIVLDIPRSVQTADHWGKWLSALEDIKNGHVYDKRYSWKEVFFEPPRIFITSNDRPPARLLTNDRFDVVDMLWILFNVGEMEASEYVRLKKEQDEAQATRYSRPSQVEFA